MNAAQLVYNLLTGEELTSAELNIVMLSDVPNVVRYAGIGHTTEKAHLVVFDTDCNGTVEQWVPKALMLAHDKNRKFFITYDKICDEYNNHERAL